MRVFFGVLFLATVSVLVALSGCHESLGTVEPQTEHHEIIVTTPVIEDVVTTDRYVCQIHGRQHVTIRALSGGYLENIFVKEGQSVKAGDVMFQILPVVYKARLDADQAEVTRLEIELRNTERLFKKGVVSDQEVALAKASLAKAKANVAEAQAEMAFTSIKAGFDGIVGQRMQMKGSLVEEGDILTTLADNSVMWVYFNVPENHYIDYMSQHDTSGGQSYQDYLKTLPIDLIMANGQKFEQEGRITTIEANFNNTTGTIKFRADFPNPHGLLRHGETGTVLVHHVMKNALVIPQRSTYETLDRRYVYVVDANSVAHQRMITVGATLEDIFVISKGLKADERIVFEGIRFVADGQKAEVKFRDPKDILSHLKYYAN